MTVEFSNTVDAPKSLDVEFFQDVLENGLFAAYVTIKKISFEMGCDGGDNYCSQIYRVRLTIQRDNDSEPLESIPVIVKSITVTDGTQFLEELRVFLKEKIFYYNLLPRLEILLDNVKLAPKLYHAVKKPINTLAFEDLSALGYVMADREMGLDMNHSQMVMKKLGQFHGVSMVLHKKDPDSMNSFKTGMLEENCVNTSGVYDAVVGNNIQSLIECVDKWTGYESIAKKLRQYAAALKPNLINSQQPIAGELKVLNHGDLWVNNLMFKYVDGDKKQVDDVTFIDFQMSIFGSPGYDINYFFYTSLQFDILKEKREELLHTYHTAMCDTLKANNFKDIPSFDDILLEVRRRENFGFFAHCGVFPTIAMDKTQSADNSIENFMDDDFAKKKGKIMFSSKRIEETMRYTLRKFDELGVLD